MFVQSRLKGRIGEKKSQSFNFLYSPIYKNSFPRLEKRTTSEFCLLMPIFEQVPIWEGVVLFQCQIILTRSFVSTFDEFDLKTYMRDFPVFVGNLPRILFYSSIYENQPTLLGELYT